MFKTRYEVVSVSKDNGKVVFRCTEWFNNDATIDRFEVGCVGFETVMVSKVERWCNITVKTDEEFTVGQKFSYRQFNAMLKLFADVKYGVYRNTGNMIGGDIENRALSYDSENGWNSEKIEIDDIKNMIDFLNNLVEKNSFYGN